MRVRSKMNISHWCSPGRSDEVPEGRCIFTSKAETDQKSVLCRLNPAPRIQVSVEVITKKIDACWAANMFYMDFTKAFDKIHCFQRHTI